MASETSRVTDATATPAGLPDALYPMFGEGQHQARLAVANASAVRLTSAELMDGVVVVVIRSQSAMHKWTCWGAVTCLALH